jgi:hypothetical protein
LPVPITFPLFHFFVVGRVAPTGSASNQEQDCRGDSPATGGGRPRRLANPSARAPRVFLISSPSRAGRRVDLHSAEHPVSAGARRIVILETINAIQFYASQVPLVSPTVRVRYERRPMNCLSLSHSVDQLLIGFCRVEKALLPPARSRPSVQD